MIAWFDRQVRQPVVPESRALNLYYVLPFQTLGYPHTKIQYTHPSSLIAFLGIA
jgi:hypothetical protein